MEPFYCDVWDSPIGPLTLVASARGLVSLAFGRRHDAGWIACLEQLTLYRLQLQEYLAGQRRQFTVPLDLRGTAFQLRCWDALLRIPYGETRSYADIARAIGHPRAFRAVGLANGQNPVAIIVPCHRVIASDGSLHGYGGGLALKRKLLDLERGQLPFLGLGDYKNSASDSARRHSASS